MQARQVPSSANPRPDLPRVAGMKVMLLCPYPHGSAPGQRFRYEQYLESLRSAGMRIDIYPFLPEFASRVLYQPGHLFEKFLGTVFGFIRRVWAVAQSFRYDWIFIFREAAPLGPPIIEAALFLLRRKVIFDFDDAIYLPSTSQANRFVSWLKFPSKVPFCVRHSTRTSVCNPHLVTWASKLCPDVRLIPTTIDPTYHRSTRRDRGERRPVVVGWTGTHSTAQFLDIVRPALLGLQKEFEFEVRVICDIDPGAGGLRNYRFIRWRQESEISDLDAIDIGIMPVTDSEWAKGKVGFKAIQYSALGIPPIASEIGSGPEVVIQGKTGLLVPNQTSAWAAALRSLLEAPGRIPALGRAAQEHILNRYSVPSQVPNYISLFAPER